MAVIVDPLLPLQRDEFVDEVGSELLFEEIAAFQLSNGVRQTLRQHFDTARSDFYALQYEVNGSVDRTPQADRCLARIARDAPRP